MYKPLLVNVSVSLIVSGVQPHMTFNLLRMTQTKKVITHRVSKIYEWIQGDVYECRKFLKE